VSIVRRLCGLRGGRSAAAVSLAPMLIIAVVSAVLLAQTSSTLAYPLFQSPVQTPRPTTAPPQAPTQGPAEPPQESPAVPPAESPVVAPMESPGALPPVAPEESPMPTLEPAATPEEEVPEVVATATPSGGEEGSSRFRGLSLSVLIDAAVVALSSLWLCCGGLALVIFVLLVIASFVLRVT
jgi:hypothetical protein